MENKQSIVQDKAIKFALEIIQLYKFLIKEKEFVISKQLLKSGTSIGANISEALAGQTRKDFIAKMSISSKEARETKYWLFLLQESQLVAYDFKKEIESCNELVRMLTAIVKTSQSS
jgi:four helix bundle protein